MYDLIVLGGGTAGLTAAVVGAGLGARVALVERDRTGGDCLWTGCVPSKGLLEAAHLAHAMRHAGRLGLPSFAAEVDLAAVLKQVRAAQAQIEPHDSPERLRALGVEVIADRAVFTGPRTVCLQGSGRPLRGRVILIATGSAPATPPLPGLDRARPLTSETVWDLDALPERLAVLGGGPVGTELGQAFARLGSKVTIVEAGVRLLPREESEAGELVAACLADDGVDVQVGTRAVRVDAAAGGHRLVTDRSPAGIGFDRILVATGRVPRTTTLGLEAAGVATTPGGAIAVDRRLRTSAPGVYAAGDVTCHPPFTHIASYQALFATLNGLLLARRSLSYRAIPWVTFTDPEVARVGLTEEQARRRWGRRAVVARSDYAEVDRAVVAGRTKGFAKLVGDPQGRLVGATVAAPAGGEVIAEFAAIIQRRGRIGDVYRTVHPYPTYAFGAATASGNHLQERLLGERIRLLTRPVLRALRLAGAMRR